MTAPSTEFDAFLAEDEPIVDGVSGKLIDGEYSSEGSIGVTDRRVLFLSEGDRFVDVAHDAIHSIQSRPKTRFTHRGVGYRLLAVLGALVAVAAIPGVIAFETSPTGVVLSFLTLGGAFGAETIRRSGGGSTRPPPGQDAEGHPADGGWIQRAASVTKYGGDGTPVVLFLAYVALLALVGLIAVSGSLLVLLPVLVTLGGAALSDYGVRRKRALDALGRSRRYEREVSIHLADGRRIRLRVDAAEPIDRELSGVARERVIEGQTTELAQP